MQVQNGRSGQCIFCAFRSQSWNAPRHGQARVASFSTSTRSQRQSKKSRSGRDLPRYARGAIRPTFITEQHGNVSRDGSRTLRPVDLIKDLKNRSLRSAVARTGSLRVKLFGTGGSQSERKRTPLKKLKDIISQRLAELEDELRQSELLESLELDEDSYKRHYESFRTSVIATFTPDIDSPEARLFKTLKEVYIEKDIEGLNSQLKFAFYGHVTGARFTVSDVQNQKRLADLRYPTEWFPLARQKQRTIHLHVGPTNSGKTYHALKRLEEVESGVYAGPLRLLAHEVYTRLNAKGKQCALITGEERRFPNDDADCAMSSCTVEMVPLSKSMDVAVIDEIQMIGNNQRGWAWTQALLGLMATEVHLCGEARTVPLIRELAAAMGDKLEIHRYERLSPLRMMEKSLGGDFKKLRKGDCIVSFSVMGIHALRKSIERSTGRKVAIVYGSLPPETRAQQARLFNDPNNDYDFLVASDAIGMGLNLSIKRIIFESTTKNTGQRFEPLAIADIKQIAGRAGRYRTAAQATEGEASVSQATKGDDPITHTHEVMDETETHEVKANEAKPEAAESLNSMSDEAKIDNTPPIPAPPQRQSVGLVTTLENFDFPMVEAAMITEPEPIQTAGLFPPGPIVERFASYFPPGTPFSYILLRLHEVSQIHNRFHLCGLQDQIAVADAIQPIKGLTTMDRIVFCAAPAQVRDSKILAFVKTLATCVAEQKGGSILEVSNLNLEVLDRNPSGLREYLRDLETLHKCIVLYLWLSFRFSGIFSTRALAMHVKELVEDAIEQTLSKFSFKDEDRKAIRKKRERSIIEQLSIMYDDEYEPEDEEDEERSAAASKSRKRTAIQEEEEGSASHPETEADESLEDGEQADHEQADSDVRKLSSEGLDALGDTKPIRTVDRSPLDDLDEYPGLNPDSEEKVSSPESTEQEAAVTVHSIPSDEGYGTEDDASASEEKDADVDEPRKDAVFARDGPSRSQAPVLPDMAALEDTKPDLQHHNWTQRHSSAENASRI